MSEIHFFKIRLFGSGGVKKRKRRNMRVSVTSDNDD